jgi:hypothetical protein
VEENASANPRGTALTAAHQARAGDHIRVSGCPPTGLIKLNDRPAGIAVVATTRRTSLRLTSVAFTTDFAAQVRSDVTARSKHSSEPQASTSVGALRNSGLHPRSALSHPGLCWECRSPGMPGSSTPSAPSRRGRDSGPRAPRPPTQPDAPKSPFCAASVECSPARMSTSKSVKGPPASDVGSTSAGTSSWVGFVHLHPRRVPVPIRLSTAVAHPAP